MIAALTSQLLPYLLGALALLGSLWGIRRSGKQDGRREERVASMERAIHRTEERVRNAQAIADRQRSDGRAATERRMREGGFISDDE